jgi:hypothetical protein
MGLVKLHPRYNVASVRMSDREMAALLKKCAGRSMSDYLRELLLKDLGVEE